MKKKVSRAIYRTDHGYLVVARANGRREEKRFPSTVTLDELKNWRDETVVRFRKESPTFERGTFAADAQRYLKLVSGMADIGERRRHINEWVDAFGTTIASAKITALMVKGALEEWRVDRGLAESSLNHRRTALGHFWSVTFGKGSASPVRDVPKYREPDGEARGLDYQVVHDILAHMTPCLTRLRLAIIAHTGLPHSTLARVRRQDVDLVQGILHRPGRKKGAGTKAASIPLSRRAVWYFKLLDRADGWGPFSHSAMYKTFQLACRRAEAAAAKDGEVVDYAGLRPYDFRHSFGTAVARSSDLRTVAELMGHSTLTLAARYTQAAVPELARAAVNRLAVTVGSELARGRRTAA